MGDLRPGETGGAASVPPLAAAIAYAQEHVLSSQPLIAPIADAFVAGAKWARAVAKHDCYDNECASTINGLRRELDEARAALAGLRPSDPKPTPSASLHAEHRTRARAWLQNHVGHSWMWKDVGALAAMLDEAFDLGVETGRRGRCRRALFAKSGAPRPDCPRCNGRGKMRSTSFRSGELTAERSCDLCRGNGKARFTIDLYDVLEWLDDHDQLVTMQRIADHFGATLQAGEAQPSEAGSRGGKSTDG